jgi:hypothetical protein
MPPPRRATAVGWRDLLESDPRRGRRAPQRLREPQEALSAATIALEISSRNARVAALQKHWDRLRAGLDLILDQRGADLPDLPGGASGLLVRDYKGQEPIGW